MNSLTTELVERLFEDVSTSHEAFLRGVRLSGQSVWFVMLHILGVTLMKL